MRSEGLPVAKAGYVLDNADREAPVRFAALSEIFDPCTIRHLEARGVAPGWHCLEVGAGGGSVALWLAERVGSTGRVVATDIDPRHLRHLTLPNIEARRHDIRFDSLPEGAFDLIHARLVLMHVPERERVMSGLVKALKPGGWLVDEEYDSRSLPPDPRFGPGEELLKTQIAVWNLLEDRGVDLRFGRRLFGLMNSLELAEVGAEARVVMSRRGSPGLSIIRANFEQLRRQLVEGSYLTTDDIDRDLARIDDPGFAAPSSIMWTAWGRRP